jgi:AraC family ethanolamine operon transcriptional activator
MENIKNPQGLEMAFEETIIPVFLHRRFRDFDEMTEALHAWNVEILQMDRGPFRGDIFQLGIGGVQVGRAVFNRATWQRGLPPEGFRNFAFLTDPLPHMIWRKQKVSTNSVMAFPPGGELDCVTRKAAFKVFTLSFPEELLAGTCRSMELPEIDDLLASEEVVRVDPVKMSRLIAFLHATCRDHREDPSKERSPALQSFLEGEVTRRFLGVLASSRTDKNGRPGSGRDRIFKQLDTAIERMPFEIPSIGHLCRAAQVSERTLEYAFHERFGMTPVAYLKTIRLNGVRKELLESDPRSIRIADVAGRWGFRHLGQFAADYRGHFGELPSSTLEQRRRRLACAAATI